MDFDIKVPQTKEEMDALRKSLMVEEISDDELDAVAGGNDDLKGKAPADSYWKCPYCQSMVKIKMAQDAAKHMTQACPNNPYK